MRFRRTAWSSAPMVSCSLMCRSMTPPVSSRNAGRWTLRLVQESRMMRFAVPPLPCGGRLLSPTMWFAMERWGSGGDRLPRFSEPDNFLAMRGFLDGVAWRFAGTSFGNFPHPNAAAAGEGEDPASVDENAAVRSRWVVKTAGELFRRAPAVM